MGIAPRVLPSPPPLVVQAVGDGSAWSYTRQMYRGSPHGSAGGASTAYSHAEAYPAMVVNTGSGGGGGSGGNGTQAPTQPPTQPRLEQPISKNKSPLLNSTSREETQQL